MIQLNWWQYNRIIFSYYVRIWINEKMNLTFICFFEIQICESRSHAFAFALVAISHGMVVLFFFYYSSFSSKSNFLSVYSISAKTSLKYNMPQPGGMDASLLLWNFFPCVVVWRLFGLGLQDEFYLLYIIPFK